ncbi:efflux RND transporter periplasmic adaptor subunit [Dickeya dadantii]|uniref:efflux RND transporter periplasmic adaptor subunit n=1 Tax=Dickeya dadantii TaxID=204038 RepID=UPI001CC4E9DD|nr:efflux RND transporter periplasmic adaptor subunit [Dickeya dadantii]UAY97216.1 efflux RND transporter periplasmic adaptor subunit [Dickeya dadantii]
MKNCQPILICMLAALSFSAHGVGPENNSLENNSPENNRPENSRPENSGPEKNRAVMKGNSRAVLSGNRAFAEENGVYQAHGILRAINRATLSSELGAQVLQIPFREGMAFKKGDLLVGFNCDRPRAEADAANEEVKVKKNAWDTNIELDKFQSVGRYDLLTSQAEYNQAVAKARGLAIQISYCDIRAPFSGVVQELKVSPFEAVSVSQPLITIVDPSALELNVIVPSSWLNWLKADIPIQFMVDETQSVYQGHVTQVLPQIDAVSKTVKIIGKLDTDSLGPNVFGPGMSGSVMFKQPVIAKQSVISKPSVISKLQGDGDE